MSKRELRNQLESVLVLLGSATADATTASHKYSATDVNARMAYEVGFLNGRIKQVTSDLVNLLDNL